jgi:hypothetical protein
LSGSQLYAAAEELLRGNRSDTGFLVAARLFRNAFADDELPDVYVSARKTFLVIRENHPCGLDLVNVGFKIVCFR